MVQPASSFIPVSPNLAAPPLIPLRPGLSQALLARLHQRCTELVTDLPPCPHPAPLPPREEMVACMTALHRHQRFIVDTLEVFVHEPLMEWLQSAQREARARWRTAQGDKPSI